MITDYCSSNSAAAAVWWHLLLLLHARRSADVAKRRPAGTLEVAALATGAGEDLLAGRRFVAPPGALSAEPAATMLPTCADDPVRICL
jgi:hypothetical protein